MQLDAEVTSEQVSKRLHLMWRNNVSDWLRGAQQINRGNVLLLFLVRASSIRG